MPITITLPPPHQTVGPGLAVDVVSNFIGPLPSGSVWNVWISSDPEGNSIVMGESRPAPSASQGQRFVWNTPGTTVNIIGEQSLKTGDTAYVQAQLVEPGPTVIESRTATSQWQETQGIGRLIEANRTVGQGLTEQQATQLEQTHDATAWARFTDELTLSSVVGPPSGPLVIELGTWCWGIIVRLTAIPDGLAPTTADEQYWVPTLATVRIFRGNDLWFRVPIHTPTKIVPLTSEAVVQVGMSLLAGTAWNLGMRALVNFLPGVEGVVYLMRLP